MSERDRWEAERARIQSEWDLIHEKLSLLGKNRAIETDAATKLKLEKQIATAELELQEKTDRLKLLDAKAKQIISQTWQRANLLNAIGIGMLVAGAMYTSNLYQRFALCPLEKGQPGESIGSTCFRNLKTSGEVSVFLSSSNFHLEQGTYAFKTGNYRKAIDLFEQAVDGDRTDPVPQIFLNNARARNRSQPPLKLAVVTSVDYYETAAKDVLRGVADAQNEFNQNQERRGSQYPFMEIEIANDANEPEAAKQVAQKLVGDGDNILGIIGHHASESTKAAQEIYEKANIPVISPTSSSSDLDQYKTQFFRAVGNTEKAAEKYFNYIQKTLKSEKIFIFYKGKSAYSDILRQDLEKVSQGSKYLISKENEIEVSADNFNIKTAIDKITGPHTKTALIISTNVQTNSVALATSYANYQLPPDRRLFLLGTMALSETETLEKGGKEIEGMIFVVPCSNLNSRYTSKTTKHWNLPDLSWRTATSYDATQAFAKAINLAKEKTRPEILRQLQSPSFSLSNEETSGFGLKWDLSGDRSNRNRKYCVSTIKGGKFVDIPENP